MVDINRGNNEGKHNPNAQTPADVKKQVDMGNNKLGGKDKDGTNLGNDNSKVGQPKDKPNPQDMPQTAGKISVNEPGSNVHRQPGQVAPDVHHANKDKDAQGNHGKRHDLDDEDDSENNASK